MSNYPAGFRGLMAYQWEIPQQSPIIYLCGGAFSYFAESLTSTSIYGLAVFFPASPLPLPTETAKK